MFAPWSTYPQSLPRNGGRRFIALAALFAGLVWLAPVQAQTYPRTKLETLSPPGAKVGTTVEVVISGNDLDDVKELQFSDSRIKAEWIAPPKPKIDPKTKKPKKMPPAPLKFKVTVPGNVPVGIYDARVVGKWGISNPRAFAVGDLKEIAEKEANNDVPQAQKVELNTTINGVIGGNTDVDYYQFHAKKGQRVVVYCAASEIDSRLTPLIKVYNPRGRELGINRNYADRDALVDCIIDEDGDYQVRVCQFAYIFGGAQAFYRLSITTAPWIDAVYPPVVEAGKPAKVTVYGKNLPGGQTDMNMKQNGKPVEKATVQINPPMEPMQENRVEYSGMAPPTYSTVAGFEYRLKNSIGHSNPILLTYSKEPVAVDNGKNDELEQSQKVSLPCTLVGRIEEMGDKDWYTFTAKKGEVFTFEGFAERLGAPSNLYIHIWRLNKTKDAKTKKEIVKKQLIGNYETHPEIPDRVGRFSFYTTDPKGRFTVPADGEYYVMVSTRTAYSRMGPRFVYRVNIRKENPDFQLILVSNDTAAGGGFLVHRGGCQEMTVIVLRQDGFDGEVELDADGLPGGVTCVPQIVGNKLTEGVLVLQAANNAKDWAGPITIKGTATINGKKMVRKAQAGVVVWPSNNQNQPAISRLARSICLSVRDKGPFTIETNVKELELPVGGKGEIKVKINRQFKDFKQQVQVVRLTAPALTNGKPLNFPNVNIPQKKNEATIKFNIPNNVVPGTYDLVFQGRGKYQYVPDPKKKNKKRNTDVYEVTAPIKITIYNKVAEVDVPDKLKVQAGKDVDVVVKVKRLHKYKGEFTVQLQVPGGFGGISAKTMKIPGNANQVKLTIKTAKNAKVGSSPNFKIRAQARVGNTTFTHETQFALTITKAPKKKASLQQPQSANPVRTARLEENRSQNPVPVALVPKR